MEPELDLTGSRCNKYQSRDTFLCPENVICLCLLHNYFQVHLRLDFIMEANTMNPDQTAPLEAV